MNILNLSCLFHSRFPSLCLGLIRDAYICSSKIGVGLQKYGYAKGCLKVERMCHNPIERMVRRGAEFSGIPVFSCDAGPSLVSRPNVTLLRVDFITATYLRVAVM